MSEILGDRNRNEIEPHRISADTSRRIWFATGGNDIWGNATDEELAIAELAREELDNETEDDIEFKLESF